MDTLPPVGTRYEMVHGRGLRWVGEYVGPNPAKVFETADACLVKTVETFHGGPPLGNVSAVDVKWFENHKAVRP